MGTVRESRRVAAEGEETLTSSQSGQRPTRTRRLVRKGDPDRSDVLILKNFVVEIEAAALTARAGTVSMGAATDAAAKKLQM